jgi:hypothetical protein
MPRSRCTVATRLIESMYAAVRMLTLCWRARSRTSLKLPRHDAVQSLVDRVSVQK